MDYQNYQNTYFSSDVTDILVNDYSHSKEDADYWVDHYGKIINTMLFRDKLEPDFIARHIHYQIVNKIPPYEWIEYNNVLDSFFKELADLKKFPNKKQRPTEICQECGLYKYQNEPCEQCAKSNEK
ncbi:hypothetical protein [Chengkuizengella axinellae]|uniref:Uncharacterized protein n=1 Tax=Chengkuizengella axinellae TaxID=3064388 RepID=A0ABT9IV31_9BACL|nr:hypothetical protein [Chengkuizengella sp. 2205SS18-9]MDP5273221.1 hypothetical protein [Chengkuizengella sp. 2205SS18-9]